jgi:hypothetical protein
MMWIEPPIDEPVGKGCMWQLVAFIVAVIILGYLILN